MSECSLNKFAKILKIIHDIRMNNPKVSNSIPIVQACNISFVANNKQILDNISLEIADNEILTIIGPNGAGKSTLLKILLGLVKQTTGKITKKLDLKIGYMPQKINISRLMPLKVDRFLELAPDVKNNDIRKISERLEIEKLLKSNLLSLSGGELQRVYLARAILNKPELLVLDEPASGVDIKGQAKLYKIISSLKKEHSFAVIMVSHDLHLVMSETDRVVCLNQHICCSGHPENVVKHSEFIELFGSQISQKFALYTHHHDHEHKPGGGIINNKDTKDDD